MTSRPNPEANFMSESRITKSRLISENGMREDYKQRKNSGNGSFPIMRDIARTDGPLKYVSLT